MIIRSPCARLAARSSRFRNGRIRPRSRSPTSIRCRALMAATGEHGLHELEFAAEQINAQGGVLGQKFEIVARSTTSSRRRRA